MLNPNQSEVTGYMDDSVIGYAGTLPGIENISVGEINALEIVPELPSDDIPKKTKSRAKRAPKKDVK